MPTATRAKLDALPRLTIPYVNGVPIVVLALSGRHATGGLAGVVDSGADTTLLPYEFAPRLGIPPEDLQPTSDGAEVAGGMHIPTWSLPYAIPARVIVPSDHRLGPQPWGPVFGIEPEFAKNTITVFGRRDFFRAFTVTFEHHSGPVFHLDDPGEVPTPIELD